MILFSWILSIYLATGIGFWVANWLQYAEIQVRETGSFDPIWKGVLHLSTWVIFFPILAVADYRSNVSKTINI